MILTMYLLSLHNTILFLLLFTSTILIDSMHQVMAMDVDPSQASSSSSSLLNEQEPSPQQKQYPDDQQDQGFYEEVEDERTLLDVFADNVGDILAHHMIPPTDAECKWNWSHARCEPFCQCSYQPKLGDFHLERSCRFRPGLSESISLEEDDDNKGNPSSPWNTNNIHNLNMENDGEELLYCHLPPDTPYVKIMHQIQTHSRKATKITHHTLQRVKFTIQRSKLLHKLQTQKQNVCHRTQNSNVVEQLKPMAALHDLVCNPNAPKNSTEMEEKEDGEKIYVDTTATLLEHDDFDIGNVDLSDLYQVG